MMEVQNNVQSQVNTRSFTRVNPTVNRALFFFVKRSFDLLISLLLLLLLSPLIIVISFLIYKQEGKPILAKEMKAGKDRRSFNLYTFRTLTNHSKVIQSFPPHPFPKSWEHGVPNTFTYKYESFSIRTTIGSSLIKNNLASIPKLLNIFKGGMSFIGPDPENEDIVAYYNAYQLRRLNIKPGIFSYDQMMRERGNHETCGYEEKVINDLYYIKECSYRLDIKILIYFLFTRRKLDL